MGLGAWGGLYHLSCPWALAFLPFLPVFGTAGGKEVGRSELGPHAKSRAALPRQLLQENIG